MEKRILVAFLLSFLVLSAWTAIFPPPKPKLQPIKATEAVQNTENLSQASSNTVPTVDKPSKPVSIKEEITVLENSNIKAEFSNVGGKIKKITLKPYDIPLPVSDIFQIEGHESAVYAVSVTSDAVIYESVGKGEKIRKEFRLDDNKNTIIVNVHSDKMSKLNIVGYRLNTADIPAAILNSPEKSLQEYSVALINKLIRKTDAVEFHDKDSRSESGEVSWIGFRDRYFSFVLKPEFKTDSFSTIVEDRKQLAIKMATDSNSLTATIYAGPQQLHLLASYNKNFEQIMVFSRYWILDVCAKAIYFLLHFLEDLFKNWGVAIILLGLCIFMATYPLTAKSMASMKKMQLLQPKIKALQEKYKNDPQRMNKEMMELYKENNVNPFGGCLPMLLQMPIFIGLYQVLWRSVDFKGAHFLWIKDLSMPDRLAMFPFNIPFLGNEFNILPLIMAVVMFFQQKISMQNMPVTDPAQVVQQKMMLVLMPVMMGFIFYHFASGLTIYFTIFYVLSTLAQLRMSKLNPAVIK